jgi:hypothetical protein
MVLLLKVIIGIFYFLCRDQHNYKVIFCYVDRSNHTVDLSRCWRIISCVFGSLPEQKCARRLSRQLFLCLRLAQVSMVVF